MVPVTVPSSIDRQNLRSRTIAIINGAVPTQPNDHRFQSGKANTKSNPEKIASERLLINGLDCWNGRTRATRNLAARRSSRAYTGGTASSVCRTGTDGSG